MLSGLLALLLAFCPTLAIAGPEPSAEICETFRKGPVEHEKIATYAGLASDDPRDVRFLDIWYRPEYSVGGMADLPRDDGLPNRDLLFDINLPDGQPLPYDLRMHASPMTSTFFTLLLLGGRSHLPVERMVYIVAGAPLDWSDPRPRTWAGTGDWIGPYERVKVEGEAQYSAESQTIRVQMTLGGEVTSVLACDLPNAYRNPSCKVSEKAAHWEMKASGLRLNQLEQLDRMRQIAQDFSACLSWPPQ